MSQSTLTQLGFVCSKDSKVVTKVKDSSNKKTNKKQNTFMLSYVGLDPKLVNLSDWIKKSGIKYSWCMNRGYKIREISIIDIWLIKNVYKKLREKGSKYCKPVPSITQFVNHGLLVECVSYSTIVSETIRKIGKYFSYNGNDEICILFKLKKFEYGTPQYYHLKLYYCWCQKQSDIYYYNKNYYIFVFLNKKWGF